MSWALLGLMTASACGGAGTPHVRTHEAEKPPPRFAAALRMREEAADPASDVPRTRVELVVHSDEAPSRAIDVGVFEGVCAQKHGGGPVLLRIQCWWAGPRGEIVVVRSGDVLVVRTARGGSALEDTARVELAHDAVVEPILPDALREL